MPLKKSYRRKIRGLRRKPLRKYGRPVMRRARKSYKRVVSVKRIAQLSTVSITAVEQHLVYTFKLSDLPNYTELTNLYDQYKIKGISLKFIPTKTESSITEGSINPLHSVLDFSDSTALTSIPDYLQYSTYKMSMPIRMMKRFIYPKQLQYAYDSTTAAAIQADVANNWIRSESPNVQHLGIKVCIPGGAANTLSYQVFATYYVLLKQTK